MPVARAAISGTASLFRPGYRQSFDAPTPPSTQIPPQSARSSDVAYRRPEARLMSDTPEPSNTIRVPRYSAPHAALCCELPSARVRLQNGATIRTRVARFTRTVRTA